nr:hypothetical protein [Tanacetum cinerariifolium]
MGKHKYMPGKMARSITVASAIICLATNQRFNFSKWIFESMGGNLDNFSGNFNVSKNMRRIRKRFSGRITPLFPKIMVQSQLGEGSAMPTDPRHTPIILQSPSSQPKKTHKPRKPKRKVIEVPQPSEPMEHVVDEAVYKELDDRLATSNESSSQETDSGGGPMCQEAIRDTIAQTRFENVSKHSNDLLLARGLLTGEDKDHSSYEINSLKRRVKKLERRNKSRTHKLKRLYKVGLTVRVESLDNKESLGGKEVFVEQEVIADKEKIDEVTLAQALAELKTSKLKAKGVVIQELKPIKPKKKDQIRLDEEAALKLQAEFNEEQRLARKKAKKDLKANIALNEAWDDVQAKIDADH